MKIFEKTHFYVNYIFVILVVYKTKIVIMFFFIIIIGIGLPDYPMTLFGNTFQCKLFIVCFLFGNNNTKWDYVVDNIIIGPFYRINLWKSLKTRFYVNYLFHFLLVVNNNKKRKFVVDNMIFGPFYTITLWPYLETHFNVNYSLFAFYSGTTTQSEIMLLTISYSERLTPLTYDNLWKHISMSINYLIPF